MIHKSILTILFFSFYSLIAQNYTIKKIKSSNLTLENKIVKIDSILEYNLENDSLYFFKRDYGKWLYKNKKYRKAISIGMETLNLAKKVNQSKNIQISLYRLAFYYKNINTSKSNYYFNECILINNHNKIAQNAYYRLGNNYKRSNNFIKANQYYETLILLQQKEKKYNSLARNSLYNMSHNYYIFNNNSSLPKALKHALKADSISNYIQTTDNDKYLIKNLIASIYAEEYTLNVNKSFSYYQEAINIAKKIKDTNKINFINLSLGGLYNSVNFNKSIYFLNKVQPKKKDSILISDKAFNTALTYYYKKDYATSVLQYKKSFLYYIGKSFTNNDKKDYSILKKIKNKSRILHILPLYAKTYYSHFKETKDTTLLNKSIFYYKLSDKLIDLIKENSSSFKSRMFWRGKSEKIYSRAIESCYESNNIEDALFFMEKNKALLLSEDIASQNYKLTLGIDRNLLEKEEKYKKQLVNIELNLTKNKDSLLQIKLDIERQLFMFQDSIYGGKLKKHKKTKIVTVKEIQDDLKQNEIFIEYHLSSNNDYGIFSHGKNGYVIILTKSKNYFIKLDNLVNLKGNLKEYLQLLKKPLKTKKELNNFSVKSFQIYNTIFPTKEIQELIKNKKTTIVSDGILSFLPFESLITKENNLEYLIYNTEINYAYSMTFQKENKLINRTVKNNFLGIAPHNFNYDTLSNLPETEYEIKNISKLFNGNTLIDNEASKSNFLNSSNNYNIIHFATHANSNNDNSPWIAFKNEKLFLNELYTTKTQANLIVLSACNTSLGKIETGEGIMSLARGFFYSGANSVVSSLWNVNDKSTIILMTEFYSNLKKGETKSKALHNAKLDYLKNHNQSEISPYYWSSFILIGDSGNIEFISDYSNYYWFVGLLITVILIMIILRKKLSLRGTLKV